MKLDLQFLVRIFRIRLVVQGSVKSGQKQKAGSIRPVGRAAGHSCSVQMASSLKHSHQLLPTPGPSVSFRPVT